MRLVTVLALGCAGPADPDPPAEPTDPTSPVDDNTPPRVTILEPSDGAMFELGGDSPEVTLRGAAVDAEDPDCCEMAWLSDIDGFIGVGERVGWSLLGLGEHVLTLTARDADGGEGSASVTVEIVPGPPSVGIVEPLPGATPAVRARFDLVGEATDPLASAALPDDAYVWTSSEPSDDFPQVGPTSAVRFRSAGSRTLTLTVTSEHGVEGSAIVDVDVAAPDVDAPDVVVTSPSDGARLDPTNTYVVRSDITTQGGGFSSWGFSIDYEGENYDISILEDGDLRPDALLPIGCGDVPATIEGWYRDNSGRAIDLVDVVIGWNPC